MRRLGVVIGLALVLTGCSPDYNWRTVSIADGAIEQIFPASPQQERVLMGGAKDSLEYHVATAKVDDALFMATWIPALSGQTMQALYEKTVDGILARAGESASSLPTEGEQFTVQTQGARQFVRTDLRVVTYGAGLLQLSVSAPSGAEFPEGAANEFLSYPK